MRFLPYHSPSEDIGHIFAAIIGPSTGLNIRSFVDANNDIERCLDSRVSLNEATILALIPSASSIGTGGTSTNTGGAGAGTSASTTNAAWGVLPATPLEGRRKERLSLGQRR